MHLREHACDSTAVNVAVQCLFSLGYLSVSKCYDSSRLRAELPCLCMLLNEVNDNLDPESLTF